MTTLEIILTFITTLLTIICGGGGILFYSETKKNKQISNKNLEIEAVKRALDLVQEQLEKSNEDSKEKQLQIDDLHSIVYQDQEEKAALRQINQELTWYKCIVSHCPQRQPPRKIDYYDESGETNQQE